MSSRSGPPSSQVTVRGARIAYEVLGEGPSFVWGHGLSMTRAGEDRMSLIDWSSVGATVVRYDARGHGESESTADLDGYRWDELALDQLALASELGIDTFIAAGASMGCGTALHAAVLAPERVRALVLVIPPTAWETRRAQAAAWEGAAELIEAHGLEALIASREELEQPDPFKSDPSRRERQSEATRTWDPGRLAHVMRGAARADFPERQVVASISIPALVLAWSGDPVHPMSTAAELSSLLQHSSLHVASTQADLATWSSLVDEFVAEVLPLHEGSSALTGQPDERARGPHHP